MNTTNDEYRTIVTRAGWTRKTSRGRLRVEGRDALSFLHALLSNDVQALRDGAGLYATYLTPQGRLVADPIVYHCGDHLLLDVAPGLAGPLAARLDQAIFAEDVRVEDVSATIDQLGVIGTAAEAVVAQATAIDAGPLEALPVRAHVLTSGVRIARTDDALLPSLDVFFPAEAGADLIGRLAEAGAAELSNPLVDALRIEAGRPAFGIDMTGETIPLEAGLLERAISVTKGCYVGQEVIIRVLHRGGGRVAKRLVRLVFDAGVAAVPAPGTPLAIETGETGRITSAAVSPSSGRVVALGYVHRDAADVGRRLTARDAPAEIVAFAG